MPDEGRLQPLNCPSCGREASEYEPSKWQCLRCGRRFAYEAPARPDSYQRVEHVTTLDDSSFFVCANCHGRFPRQSYPEFVCKKCDKSFCAEHMHKEVKGYCKACGHTWTCVGCLILALLAFVLLAVLGGC